MIGCPICNSLKIQIYPYWLTKVNLSLTKKSEYDPKSLNSKYVIEYRCMDCDHSWKGEHAEVC
jgi:hypothetical protein